MLTLPFPPLCLSKPLHLHPILYCEYGYSAVGSTTLIEQCFGSTLQTLKMSRGASWAALLCVLCLCFSLSHLCLHRTHSLLKDQWSHINPKAYVFQPTQAYSLPYGTTITTTPATIIYWKLPISQATISSHPDTQWPLMDPLVFSLWLFLMSSPYTSRVGFVSTICKVDSIPISYFIHASPHTHCASMAFLST